VRGTPDGKKRKAVYTPHDHSVETDLLGVWISAKTVKGEDKGIQPINLVAIVSCQTLLDLVPQ